MLTPALTHRWPLPWLISDLCPDSSVTSIFRHPLQLNFWLLSTFTKLLLCLILSTPYLHQIIILSYRFVSTPYLHQIVILSYRFLTTTYLHQAVILWYTVSPPCALLNQWPTDWHPMWNFYNSSYLFRYIKSLLWPLFYSPKHAVSYIFFMLNILIIATQSM